MSFNKIANHRNSFKSYATEKIKDASGTELTFGTLTDEGPLQMLISGTQVASFLPAYAHMYATASLGTRIEGGGVWTVVTGSGTSIDEAYLFTNPNNMKLRYNGETYTYNHRRFAVDATFCVTSSSPVLMSFALATGSTSKDIHSGSVMTVELSPSGNSISRHAQCIHLNSVVQLTASQILTIWAAGTSSVDLNIQSASFNIYQL